MERLDGLREFSCAFRWNPYPADMYVHFVVCAMPNSAQTLSTAPKKTHCRQETMILDKSMLHLITQYPEYNFSPLP